MDTPQYRDNETGELIKPENAETLAALEEEGQTPEGVYRVKFDDEGKEIPKEGEEKPKEDPKPKEEDKEDPDDDKEDDDEKEEEDEDEKPKEKRKEKYVYIGTHKKVIKENEKLAEENEKLKKDIEKGVNKNIDDKGVIDDKALDEEMVKLAEEAELDPEVIKKLGKTLASSFRSQLADKLAKIDELSENQKEALEESLYEKDFDKTISKFSPEQKEHLKKNSKNIKQRAYTDEYGGTPLRTIIIEFLHDNPLSAKKKGAEGTKSKGGMSKGSKNFEDITDEDLESMSQEESDEYFDWRDKQKSTT